MILNSLGLIPRLNAVENSCRSFLTAINLGLGSSDSVDWALKRLNTHVSNRLFSDIEVWAYADGRIFLNLSIHIDWNKHKMSISSGDDHVFVGDHQAPEDIRLIIENTLLTFLTRTKSSVKTTNIEVTYTSSKLAIEALGSSEVNRLAGWTTTPPEKCAQISSFRTIREGLTVNPRSLAEMSINARFGTSAPCAVF